MTAALFDTVLVANRGEIACRVIGTLRRLGIRAVAVYSEADRDARHVRLADEAFCIGPAPAQESYLNIDAVVSAAKASGAQAVHPGYGFLSENADFARALGDAGVAFIGPGVHALTVMGDKIRAKNHVAGYGVPVVPGIAKAGLTDADLAEAAPGIGYPLLIKPSAGGGGKGMHVVERPEDLAGALVTARRVALASFGDDTLFLERLVHAPRHIEVQVLADTHGNVIHLGERECSLQRRHQKVVEEAPSALLDERTRALMGEAACNAARSVDYTGAGTVEFLVPGDSPEEFFFMEMNTRLQVEHPVTELVTGQDLVEAQVRVAAGEPLTLRQQDVVLRGHAVEARVYAESPERGFLPTAGEILHLEEPSGNGVRVDSSLVPGLVVGSAYDPMLAKIIAWGEDRGQALARLDAALAGTAVLGLQTNIDYLRQLLADDEVRAGRLDTTLIERKLHGIRFHVPGEQELAAAALLLHRRLLADADRGPWHRRNGWRLGQPHPVRYSFGAAHAPAGGIDVLVYDDGTVSVGGGARVPAELSGPSGAAAFSLEYDGRITRWHHAVHGSQLWLGRGGWSCQLTVLGRQERTAAMLAAIDRPEGTADPEVRSPMPGTVVSVAVASGEAVEAGQLLLSVEAMKMEHQLTAAADGTVQLNVSTGDLVKADQLLAVIHAATPAPTEAAPQPEEGA
ncbi:biotin/lipoyl-binding protein [Paenarthrobacter sp. DKR-5]|uniref:ATP-binding protein n=1 Tax=Paenarthrobacter sp. DKR-5 TaxID=2835535 RepID=UPI001BDC6A80|nr:biotin carboxylase N-terminal domain-containing protein [Paenarthrobacter sp. DKR-5]MBT1002669.1 biotin/lipoyl-binding protein [Paenarthrobacter sp. DKR-5]